MPGFSKWNEYWDKKESVTTDRGTFNVYSTNDDSPFVVFCAHGAGHSALSFSLLARQLKGAIPVIAPDFKCHGDTPGDEANDLTIDSMVLDFVSLVKKIVPTSKKIILLGHSLGGSIATFASYKITDHHILSLIVIDTIEGSTVQQLPQMLGLLEGRPHVFSSEEEAVAYVATSGELENWDSAVISVSGRMVKKEDGTLTWRTNLVPSEKAWEGWFKGFANAFIKAKPYKILILPTIERLDTPFTIGHMSGKFQLSVINGTNHCVHEDAPDKVADVIIKMVKRIGGSNQW